MADRIGFDAESGLHTPEPPAQENIEPAKMLEDGRLIFHFKR